MGKNDGEDEEVEKELNKRYIQLPTSLSPIADPWAKWASHHNSQKFGERAVDAVQFRYLMSFSC